MRPIPTRRPMRGFTLIELLVVIAIIALLIGILLPALGRARESAKTAKCLSGIRQTSLAMNAYANDSKGWYPIFPLPAQYTSTVYLDRQWVYGGVAGLFSLNQVGDGMPGNPPMGDVGYYATPGHIHEYSNGNDEPLLRSYMDGFEMLYCPSDREDYYYGRPPTLNLNTLYPDGKFKTPHAPEGEQDVISYNISYMYVAGLRQDDPVIVAPPPMWGDETNGNDNKFGSWYGLNQWQEVGLPDTNLFTTKKCYTSTDNHGESGANFAFTDGHAEFLTENVKQTFYDDFDDNDDGKPDRPRDNPLSINMINPDRDNFTQTID
ncbi:MAG: prepilin-type N-terminal cleavage/methylation domain-containing protein [Phycisphaerales bacterium]